MANNYARQRVALRLVYGTIIMFINYVALKRAYGTI